MPFIFNNRAVSHLAKSIESGDTELRIGQAEFEQFNRHGAGADDFMFCVLRGPTDREIVKIIPSQVNYAPDPYLVCERGQGGTPAEAWPAGTLLYLCTTADHYSAIVQRQDIRQVDINPNGTITPRFAGEKLFQYAGCKIRWWQSFDGINPYWHLIAGEPCTGEIFEDPGFGFNVWTPAVTPVELSFFNDLCWAAPVVHSWSAGNNRWELQNQTLPGLDCSGFFHKGIWQLEHYTTGVNKRITCPNSPAGFNYRDTFLKIKVEVNYSFEDLGAVVVWAGKDPPETGLGSEAFIAGGTPAEKCKYKSGDWIDLDWDLNAPEYDQLARITIQHGDWDYFNHYVTDIKIEAVL